MYILTEILNPFYTGLRICHSKIFMDLEDGAMASVDYGDPEERKMWQEVASYCGLRRWVYGKIVETPTNDRIYYCIEEMKDLQPCDIVKQMKLDI